MKKCIRCGIDFDLTRAKRQIDRIYGTAIYNDYFPNGDVCHDCAITQISADYESGVEIIEDMGTGWDNE